MNKQTVIQWLKYAAIAAISLFFLLLILAGLVFGYYASKAPTLSEKDLIATTSSKIYDNQNNLIADLGAEKRINVKTNEIPTDLVNAIVAIEDHRFFNHRGVDFIRIGGAFFSNLRGGRQGGSTLTQQLIKLTYFSTSSSDQTLSRKIQEAWLATQLEQKATKQEILTYYINKVYMSNGNYGMQTAARSYYAKDLKDLSLPQVALLAGMPQAPNQYDPYTNPEAALQRRNLVLKEMLDMKSITNEQYESAVNTPVTDGLQSLTGSSNYPAYMDNYLKEVIQQVEEETGYNVLTTGMDVYTNVDTAAQKRLWDIYNSDEYVNYPDNELQVASTIIDVTNGKVIAQLGSRHQSSNVSFGTNQAVETNRDWGSTMKPISDYAPAIEYEEYNSTGVTIPDTPYNFPGTNTQINNWDRQYYGNISMVYALQQTRNVPAVRALEKVGLKKAQKFLSSIGIDYPEMVYANAISSNTSDSSNKYGASSEKMAAAYATFANGGTYYKPQYVNRVVFSDGTTKNFETSGTRVMKETTAYMMTDMLKSVITAGTGYNANISGLYHAGKTGTSNYDDNELRKLTKDYSYSSIVTPDELFVGYTTQYSMAVWTGYTNRLTPVLDDGIKVATDVYKQMMLYLYEQYGSGSADWTQPSGVYRSGSYLYVNNGKNNYNYYNYYYEPSPVSQDIEATEDSSSSSSSNSEENSEHTEPSAKENEQNR
ncbi:penicillin-binding protein 1A [Streptococcus australis]|uniref:Penicillin-binding protein, 1A family n=1 Tax=Streptococcus australis ATCC 700641 TaxID=888833 RepID=E7SD33_9STRE|nr:penicillin-binding protein PBP1A [Streptococcus australis]EFV98509.1 penicillin-binding protein, 1A family [Streptococcus australis ATCC 700641]EGU66640.1 penicillin-binding protein 1A [Streptococcus australis ATCC 700641]SQH65853.1 penicillin-binding protein 1A [Streptococcus australis]